MKTKLLRKIRKKIRITPYSYGFYDVQIYKNFKWNREGSYHFFEDALELYHLLIRDRLYDWKFLLDKFNKF